MKARILPLALILPTLAGCADPPPEPPGPCTDCAADVTWIDTFPSSDPAGARVAADPHGNVLVVGTFTGTLEIGGTLTSAGGADVFVAKLDPAGHVLWSKSFGSGADDYSVGFGTDASGAILLAGQLGAPADFGGGGLPAMGLGSLFVVKLDADGHHVWSRGFPGQQYSVQSVSDVAVDPQGDLVLRGLLGTEPLDFGDGPLFPPVVADTLFLAKLRGADGSAIWSRMVEAGHGFGVGPGGEVVLGATFPATVADDGGVIENSGYLTKLDRDGAVRWTAPVPPLYWFYDTSAIAVDPQGNVITSGECRPEVLDVRWCAQSLDPDGALRWTTELGAVYGEDNEAFLATGPGGESIATYSAFGASTVDGTYPFARKLGPDGALRWRLDVKSADQFAQGVAFDAQGAVLLAGSFRGTIDLGTGPVPEGGTGTAIFVAKLAP
jgi:hypothetical protein